MFLSLFLCTFGSNVHRNPSCNSTLPPVVSMPVKHMTIPPWVQMMFALRLCRCAGCMGLIEFEDLESALQLAAPGEKGKCLVSGLCWIRNAHKEEGRAKKDSEGEVGGHTESEGIDRERGGKGGGGGREREREREDSEVREKLECKAVEGEGERLYWEGT